jgi:hypothetical protein
VIDREPLPETELQIVPVTPERKEIERWPAWIIQHPPIDDEGNFKPAHDWIN